MVYEVKASSCTTVPLGTDEKETSKKLIVFDTGVYLTENGLNGADILAAGV